MDFGSGQMRPVGANELPALKQYAGNRYSIGLLQKDNDYRVISPSAVKDGNIDTLVGGCE